MGRRMYVLWRMGALLFTLCPLAGLSAWGVISVSKMQGSNEPISPRGLIPPPGGDGPWVDPPCDAWLIYSERVSRPVWNPITRKYVRMASEQIVREDIFCGPMGIEARIKIPLGAVLAVRKYGLHLP